MGIFNTMAASGKIKKTETHMGSEHHVMTEQTHTGSLLDASSPCYGALFPSDQAVKAERSSLTRPSEPPPLFGGHATERFKGSTKDGSEEGSTHFFANQAWM